MYDTVSIVRSLTKVAQMHTRLVVNLEYSQVVPGRWPFSRSSYQNQTTTWMKKIHGYVFCPERPPVEGDQINILVGTDQEYFLVLETVRHPGGNVVDLVMTCDFRNQDLRGQFEALSVLLHDNGFSRAT